jgi:hypothetical protein
VQLVVACVAFLPVLTLLYGVWVGRTQLAGRALATTIVLYALWALLNDAAVHGWNDRRLISSVLAP